MALINSVDLQMTKDDIILSILKNNILIQQKNGFKCDVSATICRESLLASRFPIEVDIGHKKYGHIGNITCAAAAVTSKAIISAEEFYILYEIVSGVVIV